MLPLRFPYCCLMLLCLCCLQTLQAQNPKKKTKSDVEVINFGDETDAKKGKEQTYRRIIVKTSPLAFVFGRQPFEVEKEMNDYLSLQVGLGFTFEPLWAGYDDLLSEIRD
ncbi:MAG TPA: hypothetical protein PK971_09195, partial [Saprospiraceae bacterium]|nr:hypothetical protein [Saprospiraceae bacterium]